MIKRRVVVQAALLAAASLRAWAEEPAPFEPLEFDWADVKRQRPVPVRLYWPNTVSGSAQVPLVVFSHGIGGSRRGYRYLGEHWAAQGFASLHVQHVGSDRSLWSGNPFALVGRLQGAAQDQEAIARVLDVRFALDTLLAGPLAPRIDASRIAAAGHSYGANSTLLAAGARLDRQGRVVDFRDERIRAAILLSAPPFYGESDPAGILAHVTVPTLHVTATEDVIRIPGYYSGAEDRVSVFEATGSRAKALAVFQGGSHSIFTDRLGTGGATLNPQVKEATRALSVAFLRRVFDGDEAALRQWPDAFAGIVARFTRAGL